MVPGPFIVVLDANVLFPFSLRDTLLRAAAAGFYQVRWSSQILDEMTRNLVSTVLVWSFYEKPDADAFLRECNQLFLGEEEGPAGGRLERLERGLRDGRPHLIVLDGLEREQEDAGAGRVRGELSEHTLKLLLRALAFGLGRARALVTSRFPLVDLQDWHRNGYRETRLDDLSPEAAVAVLRGWGVVGQDPALRAAAEQVGHHAVRLGRGGRRAGVGRGLLGQPRAHARQTRVRPCA